MLVKNKMNKPLGFGKTILLPNQTADIVDYDNLIDWYVQKKWLKVVDDKKTQKKVEIPEVIPETPKDTGETAVNSETTDEITQTETKTGKKSKKEGG
jgi:hypothetical protein